MKKFKIFKNESLNSFLDYSFRYKWSMLGVIALSAVTSMAGAVPAWLSKYLIDDVFVNKNRQMMYWVITGVVVSTIIKVVTSYYAQISSSYVTETIRREIRLDIFRHLQNLPLDYFKKNKLGDVMARLNGDSGALGTIGFTLFEMLKELIAVLALLFRMFQVDWILALLSLTVFPFIITMVKSYTKKIRKAGRIRQDTFGQVASFMQEALSGVQVIKAFNRKEMMVDRYYALSQDEFKKSFRSRKIKAKVNPINEVMATIMIALVALYGGYNIIRGHITAGDLVSFITAVGLMQQPLKRLIDKNNSIQEALPSADRVIEMMDIPQEVEYFGEKKELFSSVDTVEFENLWFKYEEEGKWILKDLNFKVNKGDVVALVGKSGSGKTTLVGLIPRFYEVNKGCIKINGTDVKNYSINEYRSHIGIVPQETFLFSGTIAENLKFGRDDVTEEEVIAAAKMANAYDFIIALEKGFGTEVGERGVLLSGGQKQRIAIARALIQNPQIMILDEATSALDTESERLVQTALDKLMENRTTFVIAHRLSTIVNATKIVVMDDGEIKEIGNHQELIEKNGIYKKLYDIQFKA
ncbi:MAG: ABC transporter ATP-binding protein [Fusobacteriaceae bacterium]|nr:ABC transporter ATP-binding protein [Fusobacteriaceae bacterium]